jgi:hypothetical protein
MLEFIVVTLLCFGASRRHGKGPNTDVMPDVTCATTSLQLIPGKQKTPPGMAHAVLHRAELCCAISQPLLLPPRVGEQRHDFSLFPGSC